MERIRAGIVGGSGYGGRELLRILTRHPHAEVAAVTSRRHAGRSVAEVHETLPECGDLLFTDPDPAALAREVDALLFALPYGEAAGRMRAVLEAAPDLRVIDLSGDFRLRDPEAWEAAYGRPHPSPELSGGFVYGLPELFRAEIRSARRVANPGCFATGAILALLPLAAAGRLPRDVVVNGVTGSSGSGVEPKPTTHHPERAEDYRAYRPLAHQHVPEIEMALRDAGAGPVAVAMVPHSGPFVRGIFITAYVYPDPPLPLGELRGIYAAHYGREPFVRLRESTPRVAVVRGTNRCELTLAADPEGRRVVILGALDNLVKGMAGQAVQNLNLLFGLKETEGLL